MATERSTSSAADLSSLQALSFAVSIFLVLAHSATLSSRFFERQLILGGVDPIVIIPERRLALRDTCSVR